MNRKWLSLLLSLFGLLIFYELFNTKASVFLIIIGLLSLFLNTKFSSKKRSGFLFIALISLSLALSTSRLFLVSLIVLTLLLIGNNKDLHGLIREAFSKERVNKYPNDFIMVNFEKVGEKPAKITRNKWLGDDSDTIDTIYSWEDVNFTKMIGNTVFDLGNTLLPKKQNIILIRKGIGHTKIIVPEGIAVSLDVSTLIGKIIIKETEYSLLNENFQWQSENYQINDRKIKIVANTLLGEVEVIFL